MENSINSQFVSYKIAKKLKELGFNEECFGFYQWIYGVNKPQLFMDNNSSEVSPYYNNGWLKDYVSDCAAPLWQQASKFLYDKYDYLITINPQSDEWVISKNGEIVYEANPNTQESAILKALELITK